MWRCQENNEIDTRTLFTPPKHHQEEAHMRLQLSNLNFEASFSGIFLRLPGVGQGFIDLTGQGLSAWNWWSSLPSEERGEA